MLWARQPSKVAGRPTKALSGSANSGGRGKKRAQVAVAHSLLVAICHMLKDGTMHHDLGADYFEKRDRDQLVRRAVSRLQLASR